MSILVWECSPYWWLRQEFGIYTNRCNTAKDTVFRDASQKKTCHGYSRKNRDKPRGGRMENR